MYHQSHADLITLVLFSE